jgi:hypothetical protein
VRSDQRTHTHTKNRMIISQQYAKPVHKISRTMGKLILQRAPES